MRSTRKRKTQQPYKKCCSTISCPFSQQHYRFLCEIACIDPTNLCCVCHRPVNLSSSSLPIPVCKSFSGVELLTRRSSKAKSPQPSLASWADLMTANGGDGNESPILERIYIGGLDPPRLGGRDILQRLKAIEDVEIQPVTTYDKSRENSDVEDGDSHDSTRPFIHITAISKRGSDSALSIIAKHYHNVKWKGCKLAVEAAKPSFLDRLTEERLQRSLMALQSTSEVAEPTSPIVELNPVHIRDLPSKDPSSDGRSAISNLPRRLRIRKKFGEEAYHVDTKPWSVDDWGSFHRARTKLQKRLEKHQEKSVLPLSASAAIVRQGNKVSSTPKQKQASPSNMMHRAVHIRFALDSKENTDDDNVHHNGGGTSSWRDSDKTRISIQEEQSSLESSSSSSSTEDDDGDQSDSNYRNNYNSDKKERFKDSKSGVTSYVWSSDDDNEQDEDDKNSCYDDDSNTRDESDRNNIRLSATAALTSSGNACQAVLATAALDSQRDSPESLVPSKGDNRRNQYETYDWSSDDETSNGDENRGQLRRELGLRPAPELSATDEFAAGLYGTKTFEENEETYYDDAEQREGHGSVQQLSGADNDLKDDVAANLNILSSIFSDILPSQTAYQKVLEDDHTASKDLLDGQPISARHRTPVSGIMPRYDPLAESSKRYLVETTELSLPIGSECDKPSTQLDNSTGTSQIDTKNGNGSHDMVTVNEVEVQEETEVARNVYKQDKLESVFRDARQAWENPNTVATSAQSTTTNSGAFTFGFNLDNDQQQIEGQKKSNETFSFAFKVPGKLVDMGSNQSEKSEVPNSVLANDSASLLGTDLKAGDIGLIQNVEVPVPEIRRKGFTFPDRDIQKYVHDFFSLNDGLRVMEDLERFRNDAEDKEAWKRERQTLTLDWKRKRKYAITRIQKRVKL
jgi:hypothetical protein